MHTACTPWPSSTPAGSTTGSAWASTRVPSVAPRWRLSMPTRSGSSAPAARTSKTASTSPTATSPPNSPTSSSGSATTSTKAPPPTSAARSCGRMAPPSPPTWPATATDTRSTRVISICSRRTPLRRGTSSGTTTRSRTTTPASSRKTPSTLPPSPNVDARPTRHGGSTSRSICRHRPPMAATTASIVTGRGATWWT